MRRSERNVLLVESQVLHGSETKCCITSKLTGRRASNRQSAIGNRQRVHAPAARVQQFVGPHQDQRVPGVGVLVAQGTGELVGVSRPLDEEITAAVIDAPAAITAIADGTSTVLQRSRRCISRSWS